MAYAPFHRDERLFFHPAKGDIQLRLSGFLIKA